MQYLNIQNYVNISKCSINLNDYAPKFEAFFYKSTSENYDELCTLIVPGYSNVIQTTKRELEDFSSLEILYSNFKSEISEKTKKYLFHYESLQKLALKKHPNAMEFCAFNYDKSILYSFEINYNGIIGVYCYDEIHKKISNLEFVNKKFVLLENSNTECIINILETHLSNAMLNSFERIKILFETSVATRLHSFIFKQLNSASWIDIFGKNTSFDVKINNRDYIFSYNKDNHKKIIELIDEPNYFKVATNENLQNL